MIANQQDREAAALYCERPDTNEPASIAGAIRTGELDFTPVVQAFVLHRIFTLAEAEIGLFEAMAHGDEEHRAWLKGLMRGWFAKAKGAGA